MDIYVGGIVYGNMGKPQYVVWYVLTVWDENTVYGMVRLRYGTVWYDVVGVLYV